MGSFAERAAASSALSDLTADEMTTIAAPSIFSDLVADENLDALLAKAVDIVSFGQIRSLHFIAKLVQDLGDTGHPDPANPDKMQYSNALRHYPHKGNLAELNGRNNKNYLKIRSVPHRHGAVSASLCNGFRNIRILDFFVRLVFPPSQPRTRPKASIADIENG